MGRKSNYFLSFMGFFSSFVFLNIKFYQKCLVVKSFFYYFALDFENEQCVAHSKGENINNIFNN